MGRSSNLLGLNLKKGIKGKKIKGNNNKKSNNKK